MRRIRFRGKRLDNGDWVYGDLLQVCGGYIIYHGSQTESDEFEDDGKTAIYLYKNEVSAVHPDTVGQFTGLLDRNGKEIYEGDIVEYSDHRPTLDGHPTLDVGEVKYESGALWLPTCLLCEASSMRIIGNIHDNPKNQKQ